MSDGTVLTRGESQRAKGLANDTVLKGGKSSSSLVAGLGLGSTGGITDGTALGAAKKTTIKVEEPVWKVPRVVYDETGRPLPWWEDGSGELGRGGFRGRGGGGRFEGCCGSPPEGP